MSPECKQRLETERAEQILANWETCPLTDLLWGAGYLDRGLLYVITRYNRSLGLST